MRRPGAAALLLLLACACTRSRGEPESASAPELAEDSGGEEGEPKDAPNGEEDRAPGGPEEEAVKEIDVERAPEEIRALIAEDWDVEPSKIEVELAEELEVPGVVLFSAELAGGRMPDSVYGPPSAFGLFTGDALVTDTEEAMALVARAWGYGEERSVPVEEVARVFGFLEGKSREPAKAVWKESIREAVGSRKRGVIELPKETEVDGRPAVEYFVLGKGGGPSLWKSTVVFHEDGNVTRETEVK